MALSAANIALGDLRSEAGQRYVFPNRCTNLKLFVASMIKLKNDEIIFATIYARMISQILSNVTSDGFSVLAFVFESPSNHRGLIIFVMLARRSTLSIFVFERHEVFSFSPWL